MRFLMGDLLDSFLAIGRLADHHDIAVRVQHATDALSCYHMVIGDKNTYPSVPIDVRTRARWACRAGSGTVALAPPGCRWKPCHQARPTTRSALHVQGPTKHVRALTHTCQSKAAGRRPGRSDRGVEALPVVLHGEHHRLGVVVQAQGDAVGLRVLACVGERLLRDATETGL